MRKPQDPRNHGLTEPSKVHSKIGQIPLHFSSASMFERSYVRLHSVVDAWHKVMKDHEGQGHRLGDPHIINDRGYGTLMIEYSYEWDNLSYEAEKAGYDAAIATYQEQLESFLKWEENQKNNPPDLAKKIERAKQRLANLEAARDGQPLPFPEP